jgi:hypothetical protein
MAWSLAAAGAFGALAVLYLYNPMEVGFYPRCLLYVFTGVYCPGCGVLRATYALLHGHVLTALDYNALYVATLPFALYVLAAQVLTAVTGRPVLPVARLSARAAWAIAGVLVAFTVLRNVPVYPFSVLAP